MYPEQLEALVGTFQYILEFSYLFIYDMALREGAPSYMDKHVIEHLTEKYIGQNYGKTSKTR